MPCLRCKNYSWKSLYCRECRKDKEKAVSIVSQNKIKLIKICKGKVVSKEWLDRLNLYTTNINTYALILLQYKEEKTDYLFYKIVNSFTVFFFFICCFFAFELVLVN